MLACSSSEDPFKFCQLPQSCPLRQRHPPPSLGASRGRGSGSPPSEDSPVPLGIRDRVPVKSECPGFGFADTPEQTQAAGAAARGEGRRWGGVLWAVDMSLCHSWGRSPGRLNSGLQGSPWKGHSSRVLCGARGPASVRCHCYWVLSQVVTARTRHGSVSSRHSLAGLPLQGGAVSCPRSSIKSVFVNRAALGVAGSHLLLPLFYFDAGFFQLGGSPQAGLCLFSGHPCL